MFAPGLVADRGRHADGHLDLRLVGDALAVILRPHLLLGDVGADLVSDFPLLGDPGADLILDVALLLDPGADLVGDFPLPGDPGLNLVLDFSLPGDVLADLVGNFPLPGDVLADLIRDLALPGDGSADLDLDHLLDRLGTVDRHLVGLPLVGVVDDVSGHVLDIRLSSAGRVGATRAGVHAGHRHHATADHWPVYDRRHRPADGPVVRLLDVIRLPYR